MSSPAPVESRSTFLLQIFSGAVIVSVGILALFGWHTERLYLTGFAPKFPPMHYIAACCFIISGAAIALSAFRNKLAALFTAGLLILIATAELSFTLLGFPDGMSELLIHDSIIEGEFHLTTLGAVTFLFIALALIIRWRVRKHGPIISGSFGAFSLACGLASILGFASGYADSLHWGAISEISISGAIAFFVAGVIIIFRSRHENSGTSPGWKHYVPVAILVTGLTVSFCFRQYMHVQEVEMINRTVVLELENLKRNIESEVSARIGANERMADRWAEHGGTSQEIWEHNALRYYRDYGGYQALEWVDKTYRVRWVVPFEENKKALGLNLVEEKRRFAALEQSRLLGKTTVSEPIQLVQGGTGFLTYTPIQKGETFEGFILGVFRMDTLFALSIPKSIREGYSVEITDKERVLYSIDDSKTLSQPGLDRSGVLDFRGTQYRIRIRPNKTRLNSLSANMDGIALLLGTLISLLVSGAVFLAQRAHRNSAFTARANDLLKSEIEGRKRIETMLRETSTFREAILDGANCMIISTDKDGLITSFNQTAEILLGYTAADVVGLHKLDYFHFDEEIEAHNKELIRKYGYQTTPGFESLVVRARDRIVDEREWTYTRKNGSNFPAALSITAIFNEYKEVTGYIAIGRDNSQLYNTSQRLLESEERFKAVVNNTPALVYIKDKNGRFIFSNNKFESLLELEAGELIGKTVHDFTDEKTAKKVREIEKRVLKTGTPEESSELILLGDKPLAHYLFVRFAIPSITQEKCLGVIAIDLSPQLAVEEELRTANRAAVDSSRMKSEFLANMSHEIRTPMNGVLGMLEVLLDTALNTSQREYAEVIQESARSLLTILDDILDFSKLEAGKLTFETIEFDLRSTLENTIALFAEAAEAKGIEVTSLIEPEVPTGLLGDPGRFRQVLTNLVGNGVKFTESGEVTIRVSQDSETDGKTVLRIDVEDTGIGISDDAQQSLFEAFVQADGSMVRKYGGTGLGLSISKQLVELMHGTIGVESSVGEGSVFTFTVEFGVQEDAEVKSPSYDLNGVKVLVTDDLEANRKNIVYQLEGLGIDAHEAEDGTSCVSILFEHAEKNEPFDIVLLDYEMPNLNGFETAELINRNPALNNTNIVMMPTHGRRGHAQDAIQTGISAYLIKPIRQVELFDCITTIMVGLENKDAGTHSDSSGLITRHSLMEKRNGKAPPVLVASGDTKLQGVISMQLELLGYRSELVSDGNGAIEAIKRRNYALILMELEMQGLNGADASERIRKHLNEKQIPIVGITNHPSREGESKAMKAGMNGYYSLPMSEELLSETITGLLHRESPSADDINVFNESEPATMESSDPVLYEFLSGLVDEIGSDMAMMTVSLFAEDANRHIAELKDAAAENDFKKMAGLGESMKLVCETISAHTMQEICEGLLTDLEDQNLENLQEQIRNLENAFVQILDEIEQLSLAPSIG